MNNDERRLCPACRANQPEAVGFKDSFEILVCAYCRTIYTGRIPDSDEAVNYDEYYSESNLSVPAFILNRLDEIIGEFASFRQSNRLLDIGFGAGTLLESAAGQGWRAFGLEVSKPAFEQARAKGFEVFHGSLLEAAYPDNYFDVVTASEILEHISAPQENLAEIARILRPGGIFWATTPSARGISYRLLKLSWSILCPPDHIQLYSKKGLSIMLKEAGFRNIEILAFAVNPGEILSHFRSVRSGAQFDRVKSGYALNESMMKSPIKRRIKSVANHTLSFLGIGDSLKIYARKPG
ncbi:MAG: class I SAM-dependent methyltransferase [Pyrinomonadaceae bacterium]